MNDKSYQHDHSIMKKNLEANRTDFVENAKVLSELRKISFDGYVSAGFSEAQAIELVKAEIMK